MGRYGDEVAALAAPLTDAGDLDVLLDRVGGARVVMLGEASHGTHEFYAWRAVITRRLIEEKGFSFVAVEGDWPDCDRVDRAVRCLPDAPADPRDALLAFERWPTWNVRDRHMDDSLDRLLEHYGRQAKAVVWAHNTHVGDARATDMAEAGQVNIGQLARDRYGAERVVLVGFGTHRGTVVAGDAWGAPMQVLPVPPARRHSLEEVLHTVAPVQALVVFPQDDRPDVLTDQLDHRAIGVVYRPDREKYGNYVPTVLGDRYDAFAWFDRSQAVRPLHLRTADTLELETYPSGI
jgi:erythromycin esterase-like protein